MMEFDYVVVGAGSAGCAVAARLSEDGRHSVCLIEAGGRDSHPALHVPIGFAYTMNKPQFAWLYTSQSQVRMPPKPIPRGRVLGGSSAINGLVYIRGQREDYDNWAQLGCTGWSYEDVLPYFRRSEDQIRGADEFHGVGGPIKVDDLYDTHPLDEAFINGCGENGIPRTNDFNGANQEGAGYFQLTARNGLRCSAATGYLKPARSRANLQIITGAVVDRIIFEGSRARAIEIITGDARQRVSARAEIVMSAGAYGSPSILQRSGIGDPARLQALNIPVVVARPQVGQNLQEHFAAVLVARVNPCGTFNERGNGMSLLKEAFHYAIRRRGLLASSPAHVSVFARVLPGAAVPDVQILMLPGSATGPGTTGLDPFPALTAAPMPVRPESRGHSHIASSDPNADPNVFLNVLSDERDIALTLDAMKLVQRIFKSKALQAYGAVQMKPLDGSSDEEMIAVARESGSPQHHPVGTCRMGRDEDAVVDVELCVRGVQGLRIADASIMPRLISGNTNAPTIMIGEKAADLIRAAASA